MSPNLLCRLYNEAKITGLFIGGSSEQKAPMFSALMHMFSRAQRFEMVWELTQDTGTYSIQIKMNTLVVCSTDLCQLVQRFHSGRMPMESIHAHFQPC